MRLALMMIFVLSLAPGCFAQRGGARGGGFHGGGGGFRSGGFVNRGGFGNRGGFVNHGFINRGAAPIYRTYRGGYGWYAPRYYGGYGLWAGSYWPGSYYFWPGAYDYGFFSYPTVRYPSTYYRPNPRPAPAPAPTPRASAPVSNAPLANAWANDGRWHRFNEAGAVAVAP